MRASWIKLIPPPHLHPPPYPCPRTAGHWARQALQQHLGICHMQCVPVRHCSGALVVVAASIICAALVCCLHVQKGTCTHRQFYENYGILPPVAEPTSIPFPTCPCFYCRRVWSCSAA